MWRIPEKSLHTLELLGGWPGALLAQRTLRHKNRKPSYQVVFWLIVGLHVAGLAQLR
ncbi:Cold-shock protein (fragment) [Crenothrix polyspora]|uniref:Cold-shock protein n=1 Tax=Crenothrix polyspora TaxID=360316 RepID=A0A1R4H535_9GAMM